MEVLLNGKIVDINIPMSKETQIGSLIVITTINAFNGIYSLDNFVNYYVYDEDWDSNIEKSIPVLNSIFVEEYELEIKELTFAKTILKEAK